MAKQKYYVVWVGKQPGIYTSWPECQAQVSAFKDAKYKAYESKVEAERAFQEGWKNHWGQKGASAGSGKQMSRSAAKASSVTADSQEIDYDSISVDVGTKGNPGPIEYRGVCTQTGEVLFAKGPIPNGTNNLGEFLAIVHSLAYLKQKGSSMTIYSDSQTAMKWVRDKKVATSLERNASTKQVWELVDRALHWLETNSYDNKILKWQTQSWGEIKADYGRK